MDAYRGVTDFTAMTSIGIARGNVARIQNGRGVLLSVQHGAVWITQSGSPDDVCIGAGQSFRIARNGLTLVVPVGTLALVTLVPATRIRPSLAERIATRLWSFWAGLYWLPSRPSASWL
ncbi:MAG TPA: DUF2917 domain-containing protein [Burkholderiales bacterium]|nr:DUF2917 domain-containing protein [Burkholderiales bacterium]